MRWQARHFPSIVLGFLCTTVFYMNTNVLWKISVCKLEEMEGVFCLCVFYKVSTVHNKEWYIYDCLPVSVCYFCLKWNSDTYGIKFCTYFNGQRTRKSKVFKYRMCRGRREKTPSPCPNADSIGYTKLLKNE